MKVIVGLFVSCFFSKYQILSIYKVQCVHLYANTKGPELEVRVRPTDSVHALLKHIKASHDVSGGLTTNHGEQFDKHTKSTRTLQDVGIADHPVVVMKSLKTHRRQQHIHPVTIYRKSNENFTVDVRSVTDISELKHIVQDKLAIPMDEQQYSQKAKPLENDVRVVSLCRHGRGKLILTTKSDPANASQQLSGMFSCFHSILSIIQYEAIRTPGGSGLQ